MRLYRPPSVIGIAEDVDPQLAQKLGRRGLNPVTLQNGLSPDKLIEAIKENGIDAIATRTGLTFNREILRNTMLSAIFGACKNPKVPRQDAMEEGVHVLKADENQENVARLAIANILAFINGTHAGTVLSARGEWGKKQAGALRETPQEQTIGIIGFGLVGQAVAREAKKHGFHTIAYNDTPLSNKDHHRSVTRVAIETGTKLVNTIEELEEANILTIHVGPLNHEEQPNGQVITLDFLREWAQGRTNSRKTHRILLNLDRTPVGPSEIEIDQALIERILTEYATDVFREEGSKFKTPDFQKNHAEKVIATPHIGGSGKDVDTRTGIHLARRIPEFARTGTVLDGDSTLWRRQRLGIQEEEGSIVLEVISGTQRGVSRKIQDSITLDIANQPRLGDKIPGTSKKYPTAPQIFELEPNGKKYGDSVQELATALTRLGDDTVVSVRFIPTNEEQKQFWASNPEISLQ